MTKNMHSNFSQLLPACADRIRGLETTISIPEVLQAKIFITQDERLGFWEKSLVVVFPEHRQTLSTFDGLINASAVVNHSAHWKLWEKVGKEFMGENGRGGQNYVEYIREKLANDFGLNASSITKIATAVDINNMAVVTKVFESLTVTVLVTAGAETNAMRAGIDLGSYTEGQEPHGTINIIVLTNAKLTVGAMARAIVTATEAKTASLQDLDVPSCYTPDVQATGTGTDSVIVVSGSLEPAVSYTGGHSRIGWMIGQAVYEAVVKALAKHNESCLY